MKVQKQNTEKQHTSLAHKRKEFERLSLTGKYTKGQCGQMVGITKNTVTSWSAEIPALRYLGVRKDLLKQLEARVKSKDYESNSTAITALLEQVERVEALIRKAKYSNV